MSQFQTLFKPFVPPRIKEMVCSNEISGIWLTKFQVPPYDKKIYYAKKSWVLHKLGVRIKKSDDLFDIKMGMYDVTEGIIQKVRSSCKEGP